jgi:hypothetical protein
VTHAVTQLGLQPYVAEITDSDDERPVTSGLIKNLLSAQRVWQDKERSGGARTQSGSRAGAGPLAITSSSEFTTQTDQSRLAKTPVQDAIDALEQAKKDVFIIDNFEWLAESADRELVYGLVKRLVVALSDRHDCRPITLVIIGPEEVFEPILDDERAARRTRIVDVTHMQGKELEEILLRAQDDLGVSFSPEALEVIVDMSDGDASLTHRLGERSCEMALGGTTVVDREHVIRALRDLRTSGGSFWQAFKSYERALQLPGGAPTYRQLVMQALAGLPPAGATLEQLDEAYRGAIAAHGVDAVDLRRPLRELTDRSQTLEQRPDGRIAFRLSATRSYVRCITRYPEAFAPDVEVESLYE